MNNPNIPALAVSGSSALLAINAPMLKRTKLAGIRRLGGAAATVAAQVPA
ncbi:hypothetical protein TPL01_21840 [Sulfuriferula plumbiphila]|uniref:Uncharacterized protein n=1 Tax=Sulfuriferula plumbiphila TaxID=171865 RepID=A0A512L976_9PROT|nr:hypothetical protein [Sulfuriferula plumbiphila]BBP03032.1 hypothetical protein SFPGR_04540 [Sulfuriferula plumbiphila]GEP31046.1 hypothetical protein TPL01_21840 [Sulfuriferula plumbiphila]